MSLLSSRFSVLAGVLLAAGCATPLPQASPPELAAATDAVIAASVRLEALAQTCAALGDDLATRVALADGTWRARHRHLLRNANRAWESALPVQAPPLADEKRALAAVRLRVDAARAVATAIRGAAGNRDRATQAAACEYELGQYDTGARDLGVATPGLAVLALPAPADAADDLAVPLAGRDLMAGVGVGLSLPQVQQQLAGKRCRAPVVVRLEEDDTHELYVASCDSGRRYVARCAFRNCTLE